jgi:NADH dehydrogenase (ubiquinone) 1 alpha/beta subcomplex 1
MALAAGVAAVKQGLLRHLRVPLQEAWATSSSSSSSALAGASVSWARKFAGGGYLDKTEVTDRVINVTKHFEKIDPAKVRQRCEVPCQC